MPSALDTLRGLLVDVRPLLVIGAHVPAMGTEKQDLAVLSTALCRKAYLQAGAVAAVAASDVPESALPNLRCMLEAWGELHHLMTGSDPVRSAQIAHLYALREIKTLAEKFDEPDDAAQIGGELTAANENVPDIYKEAMALKPTNYWTTPSRWKLIEDAIASLSGESAVNLTNMGKLIYKILSLEEHHVIAGITNIQLNRSLPGFGTIKRSDGPDDPEEFVPFMAAGTLIAMIKLHCDAFPETIPPESK